MNKTKTRKTDNLLMVNVEQLSAMLSCGHATARRIGKDAGARIVVGRRVLYSVKKIEYYIEMLAD